MSDEVEQCEIKKIENVDVEEYDRISISLSV